MKMHYFQHHFHAPFPQRHRCCNPYAVTCGDMQTKPKLYKYNNCTILVTTYVSLYITTTKIKQKISYKYLVCQLLTSCGNWSLI